MPTRDEGGPYGVPHQGSILEVCTCKVLCPCWIGEDPDGGTCDSTVAYHVDTGSVNNVDVSGLTLAVAVHIPGNVLKGNWRVMVFVDERHIPAGASAHAGVLWEARWPSGRLCPVVRRGSRGATGSHYLRGGAGERSLQIGASVDAELEPYLGTTGAPTLHDTIFSTIAGAPAYVGKAPRFKMTNTGLGIDVDIQNHNAIQGAFSSRASAHGLGYVGISYWRYTSTEALRCRVWQSCAPRRGYGHAGCSGPQVFSAPHGQVECPGLADAVAQDNPPMGACSTMTN